MQPYASVPGELVPPLEFEVCLEGCLPIFTPCVYIVESGLVSADEQTLGPTYRSRQDRQVDLDLEPQQ